MAASKAFGTSALLMKLDEYVNKYLLEGWNFYVVLFQNNIAQAPNRVDSDFVAATFPGSIIKDVNPITFGPAALNGLVAEKESSQVLTWINGGAAQVLFGYAVFNIDGDGSYQWGETFAAGLNMQNGMSISVQLRIKDRSNEF